MTLTTKKFNIALTANMMRAGLLNHVITNDCVAKDIKDTAMHSTFVINAASAGYAFGDDDRPMRITMAFFAATAAFLSKVKELKENKTTALILTDVAGTFKFGAFIGYQPNTENPEEAGNITIEFTLNEEDLREREATSEVKKLLYNSVEFIGVFSKVAHEVAGICFERDSFIYDACLLVIDTLVNVLEREAVEGETVDIVFPEVFTASVEKDNDDLYYGMVPGSKIKAIAKDDKAIGDLTY